MNHLKPLTVRLDETTYSALQAEAERDGNRSLSSLVRRALAAGLNPVTDVRIGEGDASRFEVSRG